MQQDDGFDDDFHATLFADSGGSGNSSSNSAFSAPDDGPRPRRVAANGDDTGASASAAEPRSTLPSGVSSRESPLHKRKGGPDGNGDEDDDDPDDSDYQASLRSASTASSSSSSSDSASSASDGEGGGGGGRRKSSSSSKRPPRPAKRSKPAAATTPPPPPPPPPPPSGDGTRDEKFSFEDINNEMRREAARAEAAARERLRQMQQEAEQKRHATRSSTNPNNGRTEPAGGSGGDDDADDEEADTTQEAYGRHRQALNQRWQWAGDVASRLYQQYQTYCDSLRTRRADEQKQMQDNPHVGRVDNRGSYCWLCETKDDPRHGENKDRTAVETLLADLKSTTMFFCTFRALRYYEDRIMPTTRKVMLQTTFREHMLFHAPQKATVGKVLYDELMQMNDALAREVSSQPQGPDGYASSDNLKVIRMKLLLQQRIVATVNWSGF